jgi:hypothetical protein
MERGRILLTEPAAASTILPQFAAPSSPYMAGIAVRSADLRATRAVLDARSIPFLYADDELICLGADEALGSYLLFHRREVADAWTVLAARTGTNL